MLSFSGCKKDNSDPEPVQTGKITGQLKLADELGNELGDAGGMIISSGGNFGISAADGKYTISNLTTGTYDLTYTKAGFGTYKRFNTGVIAGSVATVLNGIDILGQKSTTEITNLFVGFNNIDSTYNIGCSIAPVPDTINPRAFRLFFAKTNSVSSQNYIYAPSNTWLSTTASGQITGYPRSLLYNNGFSAGENVYIIAYGESMNTNVYTDPVTNKKVFPNVNLPAPSNVIMFVLQ